MGQGAAIRRAQFTILGMALGTFAQRLMNVSPAKITRKLRQRGLLAKTLEEDLLDQIPRIALSEIVGRQIVRIDGSYSHVDGSLPLCDLLALLSVLVSRSPQTVLEIGTFNGYTTRLMALNLPGAEIHTIDLPENFSDSGGWLDKASPIFLHQINCKKLRGNLDVAATGHSFECVSSNCEPQERYLF